MSTPYTAETYQKLAHSVVMNPGGKSRAIPDTTVRLAVLRKNMVHNKQLDPLKLMEAFVETSLLQTKGKSKAQIEYDGSSVVTANAAYAFAAIAEMVPESQEFRKCFDECVGKFREDLDNHHPGTTAYHKISNMDQIVTENRKARSHMVIKK